MPARIFQNVCYAVTAVLLLVLALMTLIDVVGRNVFNAPLPGSTEITEYVLVGVTFLLYPLVAHRQQHITVDVFDVFTGPRVRRLQRVLAGLLGAALFAVLAHRMWTHAGRVAGYGDVTNYLKMPVAYTYYFMSVMSGVTSIAFIGTVFGLVEDSSVSPEDTDKASEDATPGSDS